MKISNTIMLITYPDSIGNNLKDLKKITDKYFKGAIGGIHILPFFPSSGDRGFAPMDYHKVDPAFGTWEDVNDIGKDYYLMYDYMINHISSDSFYYKDFLEHKDESAYHDLFIRYKDFWEDGEPSEEQIDIIYKRKPKAPYTLAKFADGTEEKIWCTFGEEQIDINCESETGKEFIKNNLTFLMKNSAAIIRLDAFAYATKKAGSSCFFVEPEIWNLLKSVTEVLNSQNVMILPEIHEHYTIQEKIANKGYYVYDFALPMVLLNALYYGQSQYLKHWLKICPRNQFTTLDTHDGIGVVDVKDVLPDEEVEKTKNDIYKFGANVKKIYSTAAYKNLDVYQVNCTYYSALGENDQAYLIARAVQFFAPGIPQVYYVGMLAGRNDLELLEETKEGRSINRHYYSEEEISEEVQRMVVKKLLALMELRNTHNAFNGEFILEESNEQTIQILRQKEKDYARLIVDFKTLKLQIVYSTKDGEVIENIEI